MQRYHSLSPLYLHFGENLALGLDSSDSVEILEDLVHGPALKKAKGSGHDTENEMRRSIRPSVPFLSHL